MTHCELVINGKATRKGEPSIEFHIDGKPQYYCNGYVDPMTDDTYDECRRCPKWVSGDKANKDWEEAKRLGTLGGKKRARNEIKEE